ncbi:MAG: acyl-CoA dehydrogenase family protein [Acidobacteriota bacterium]|nr:acyl-CoA dehydrogenase family protein [Acidobacteriota bacterium]
MDTTAAPKQIKKGGSFIVEAHEPEAVFTPEEFTEEDYMLAQSAGEFIDGEVVPKIPELAKGNNELVVSLIKQAGELGLLSAEIPEEYGGMELNKAVASLIAEYSIADAGFAVSMGAHTGIGTMPITYFGNKEQKERYLPRLASGEILSAYALTETTAGSDALNCHTRAVLNEEGTHYILNGTKMWITNAGFADIFIVFATIDNEKFTAFIVERDSEGFSLGAEEKKMGIKSSSTRLITLDNVMVPVENLLGEPGGGAKIAFNILNVGRYKLGPACVGTSKKALASSAVYATEREAFGKTISQFGLIKQKLADMAIQTFAQESMSYRTAGYIDNILEGVKHGTEGAQKTMLEGIREYAVECCLVKVFCTESLDFVVDEAVQIHGGYGYSQEYDVERYYRDSRINRIFEGTSEINRMLSVDMLLKKGMQGQLPVLGAVQSLMMQVNMGMVMAAEEEDGPMGREQAMTENAKKVALLVSGAAVQKYMQGLADQQELLGMGADLLVQAYTMESMVLRTLKQIERESAASAQVMIDMTRVFCVDAMDKVAATAKNALCAIAEDELLEQMMDALKTLTETEPCNTVELRRNIADKVVAAGGYPIGQ